MVVTVQFIQVQILTQEMVQVVPFPLAQPALHTEGCCCIALNRMFYAKCNSIDKCRMVTTEVAGRLQYYLST